MKIQWGHIQLGRNRVVKYVWVGMKNLRRRDASSNVERYRPVTDVKRKAEYVIAVGPAEHVAAVSIVVPCVRIPIAQHLQFQRCTAVYSPHCHERLQRTRDKLTGRRN